MTDNADKQWKCTGYKDEPHSEMLVGWDDICPICCRDRNSPEYKHKPFPKIPVAIVSLLFVLGLGGYWLWPKNQTPEEPPVEEYTQNDSPPQPVSLSPPDVDDTSGEDTVNSPDGGSLQEPVMSVSEEGFSLGDRTLFPGIGNANRDRGSEEFGKGNYSEAVDLFRRGIEANRNDPEVLIYYNNALARRNQDYATFAVVVPIQGRQSSAQEMLRGVAQAQHEFNNAGGFNGKLIEIMIVDDGNDPERASQVARKIVENTSVVGVIGHNSSNASQAGLAVYENAGVPMISPTSTSTSLSSPVFFRTVPSDAAAGQTLANYASGSFSVRTAVILYNPNSAYSTSLKEAFEENFQSLGGRVVRSIDISDPGFEAKIEVSRVGLTAEAEAILLFPDTRFTSVALEVAQANHQLQEGERLKLLGGDALYSPTTLEAGASVNGLVLAVPWFSRSAESQQFSDRAEQQWGGLVNWRTAMSFDATQAFINALSQDTSRSQLLQQLENVRIPRGETSGSPLEFDSLGERQGEPILVEATRGGSVGPRTSEFGFEVID
ncbi:MAG: ABC-type branched-chain amino acid uptake system substrate-binding component LivK [Phormidium sp. OSCR]|nr:MAG: ABC-type branched-chain amino acid uptake system substrate-binding component LivK [Phormidium sp. OSCR]